MLIRVDCGVGASGINSEQGYDTQGEARGETRTIEQGQTDPALLAGAERVRVATARAEGFGGLSGISSARSSNGPRCCERRA